jgi:hypothetical protein
LLERFVPGCACSRGCTYLGFEHKLLKLIAVVAGVTALHNIGHPIYVHAKQSPWAQQTQKLKLIADLAGGYTTA